MDPNALNQLIQKRNQVAQDLERMLGRREQAQKALAELEAECRSKNIDPEHIEQTILELKNRLQLLVPTIEEKIARCAEALSQYTNTVSR